jgi:predicted GTPase
MKATKCNILMIGNSGAGKSTLVNAVFDNNVATTGSFGGGKTQTLMIYYNEALNYSVIDTKGLELGFWAKVDTLRQVNKYIEGVIKEGDTDAAIDVVWYCVDSQGKRFFEDNVKQILEVYKRFPNVPVIIVLTKAYCSPAERIDNEQKVNETLQKYDRKRKIKVSRIISVNSAPFLNADNAVTASFGIDELVRVTNELLPEAKKTSEANMHLGMKKIKNNQANLTITACVSSAVVVGIAPIPIADSLVLSGIQTGMVKGITKIYDVDSHAITQAVVDTTIVSAAAKKALSWLKSIPGLNIAASLLNGIVAGVVTVAIGKTTIIVCEKIVAGELSVSDNEGIRKFISEKCVPEFEKLLPQLQNVFSEIDTNKLDEYEVKKIINLFVKKSV